MHKIPVLNGLRGIAILSVIFHHSFFPDILYGKVTGALLDPLLILGSSGWLGVNMFFLLSGFVLFLPYVNESEAFNGWRSIRAFYIHRAKRLFPLYYTTTIIFLIFLTGIQLNEWAFYKDLIHYVFATFVFSKSTFMPSANFVLWSLGIEIWFSVIFPQLVRTIRRFGWRNVMITVFVLSLIVRIVGRLYNPVGADRPALNFISDSILGRLDEFMIGMLGAHLYIRRKFTSYPTAQMTGGLLLLGSTLVLWAMWYRGEFPYALAGLFNLLFDIGFFLIVNSLVVGCRTLSRVISAWPLQLSGMMCYSLYLWHGQIVTRYRLLPFSFLTYAGCIAFIYTLSWLTYRYIEFGATKEWKSLFPSAQN